MTDFGEIIYNVTNFWVARPLGNGVFGPPARLNYLGKFTFEFQSSQDSIRAYGMVVERITIAEEGQGTIEQATLEAVPLQITTGEDSSSSGTPGNQIVTTDLHVGGGGLPYWAWICEYASLQGARMVAGNPKSIFDKKPGFMGDQNKFAIRNAGFNMMTPDSAIRKILRTLRIEGAYTFPTDSAGFATFFNGFYS